MTLPLAGIKVVEFSEHGFVPSCAAALADFGADVVKIERPEGDPMRRLVRNNLVPSVDGYDYMFQLVNRNKRGIALEVTTPEGREVLERLVAWADIYVTNQLPRVRRKLKTEPSDLFAINPKLVFAKGHGQGQRGADAEAGGFDSVSFWSRGGVSQVLTQPGAEQPTPQRPAQGDVPSGMFLAGGICAALVHVLRTGKGIVVDTSLLNAATWTLGPDMAYASVAGAQMPQPGTSAPRSPLTHMYRTADGRFVGLMMLDDDRYWAPTCRALGLDELVAAYPDEASRRPDLEKLRQQFQDVIAGLDRAGAESRLRAAGCIYSVVAAPQEVVDDPAVVDNGYLMSHPSHPPLRLPAAPAQFDDELPVMRLPGPDLGEHTAEVLSDLGYTTAEIDRLVDAGTVIVAP